MSPRSKRKPKRVYRATYEYSIEPKVIKPYYDPKRVSFRTYIARCYQTSRRRRVARRLALREAFWAVWRQIRRVREGQPEDDHDWETIRRGNRVFCISTLEADGTDLGRSYTVSVD
jgi:hypothetical protein